MMMQKKKKLTSLSSTGMSRVRLQLPPGGGGDIEGLEVVGFMCGKGRVRGARAVSREEIFISDVENYDSRGSSRLVQW